MNQTTRSIIAVVLSFAILVLWNMYEQKTHPRHAPVTMTGQAPAPTGQTGSTGQAAPAAPAPNPAAPTPTIEPEEAPGPAVAVETPLWSAEFSPRGGALTSFVLKGRKQEARESGPGQSRSGVNLATPGVGQPLPLSSEVGLPAGGFGVDSTYRVKSHGPTELVFERTRGGVTVTKRFTWQPDSYVLKLSYAISGLQTANVPVKTYYTSFEAPAAERHWYNLGPRPEPHQTICYIEGERSVEKRLFSDTKPVEEIKGNPRFTGIDEKYFLAAMAPGSDPAPSTCSIGTQTGGLSVPGDQIAILDRSLPVSGGAASTNLDVFLGPKTTEALAAADHDMDRSIDLGFFGIIGKLVILPILKLFHNIVGNWGVAIILLTVLVKLLTLPLTHHQMKSMQEGQKLAPQVEAIKKKYAGDQTRIQNETMKMYKEHGYQPLAGCVPMLIQLPIWWALYATLGASFDLYNEPFVRGWINDLTAIDPYYITPVLMTVTMMLTQVLTPQPTQQQPEMRYMMYAMPLMFGWFMLSLPSGLVLYIFTNNLLSIAQSLWFRRKFPAPKPPTAAAS
jgi:YidC/Oxa1 family membrane protein insertase